MKSFTTGRFRKAFRRLPREVQQKAREAFRLWQENPHNPLLRFKRLHTATSVYSVRIGIEYRALGVIGEQDEMIWFWIGSHADYDNVVRSL